MDNARQFANAISAKAAPAHAAAIVAAINAAIVTLGANRASVVEACAQVLAQTIVGIGPADAAANRAAVMCLIDSYAMQVATEEGDG